MFVIFTACKCSLRNVFTGVSVQGGCSLPLCQGSLLGRHPLPPEMTIEAGGTPTTGMHSVPIVFTFLWSFSLSLQVLLSVNGP